MARPITRYESLDPQDKVVADQLAAFDITWQSGFYDGPIPSSENRLQVRTKTPSVSKIQQYKLEWERGAAFPGVVRTPDGLLVDGWARCAAAELAKDVRTIPQFVIDVVAGDASPATIANLKMFAVAINKTNGEDMPLADVAEILLEAAPDKTITAIAASLHCRPPTVQRPLAARKAMDRIAELDINLGDDDKVSISHLVLLGGWDAVLEDEVYTKFVTLTQAAGLSSNELKAVYRELKSLHTDVEKLAVLTREEANNRDRIAGHGTRPTGAGVVRRVAAQLRKFQDRPDQALDLNPDTNSAYLQALTGYVDFFTKLAAAQAGVIQNREVAIQEATAVRNPFVTSRKR